MSNAAANNDLDTKSYRELQQACRTAKLPSSGTAEVLRKRLRDSMDAEETAHQPAKRHKKSPADDLICPISLELPFDPVFAEDGRVYELTWIEEHIQNHPWDLKSPVTNQKMGKKQVPAIQHRNTIETLVESGVTGGDLAANWNENVEQEKKMEELLEKAEAGDADAMYRVGFYYAKGSYGFTEGVVEFCGFTFVGCGLLKPQN
ncbi:unknown protein [Seminavis robusta]|uniref:U-box domain-containing protein n=1 Tax=Seminavis robusta TaxID=568900 RepID=A0A9N8EXW6_9STRA|nr:unknown protein [Seminavis robusta]|eukprot:Sro1883_g303410.1 n/a (204) ;mRNA; f:4832-5443